MGDAERVGDAAMGEAAAVGTSALMAKLQVKDGDRVLLVDPPGSVEGLVGDAQRATVVDLAPGEGVAYDVVIGFVGSREALGEVWPRATGALRAGGKLWLCYPKISSRVETDMTRDVGWDVVAAAGWTGVRQVAVDATWSALRFRPEGEVGR